jgi:hypothetical protein
LRQKRKKTIRKGDKQMLIDYLKESYRELTGQVIAARPVTKVSATRPAANADSFDKAEIQARRHRRHRRLDRMGKGSVNGWTVRAW